MSEPDDFNAWSKKDKDAYFDDIDTQIHKRIKGNVEKHKERLWEIRQELEPLHDRKAKLYSALDELEKEIQPLLHERNSLLDEGDRNETD